MFALKLIYFIEVFKDLGFIEEKQVWFSHERSFVNEKKNVSVGAKL
jgi:hypothetical protein